MQTDADNPERQKPKRGAATRRRLLKHACAEFARLGYHSTKVSNIVKASGLSQPTFYLYFESKEAAYEELVGEFRQRLERLTETLLIRTRVEGVALVKSVQQSIIKLLEFLAEDPALTEIGFFQPPGCTQTKAALAKWIASNIAKEQAIGVFRRDIDALHMARCIVGMVDQMARVPADDATPHTLASGCAQLLCEGIWVRHPPHEASDA
ncbi:TetR/AcrR family transcriptional regulator [Cronobacter muytjensii]|uniref:TetR/AcrR family transcriptional regulator n=1 Tax=Cronobacter muytjensii TaxID=413501 RepID=A0A2T7AN50_9ENTR|nr:MULTISPECIES: TetR/AcrR family transcriptional regulator [Cronobacter]ALB69365.1 transcriptional regulator [Cronobacter muytjensii ATCC 51329]EGT4338163.1 TetR/AcrR family transcriptional regulator [Cronobacter muytjensii]EKS1843478.1 TetR/AcrR family transcriptional regulator [Cronobacter muytjensii]ELY4518867.1 TetR/AcrR family transcriptional regulator [Cronobacter muytjensii]ELY6223139.1 TetR/AcrR family transcriptional regulator [Cronobacter muytjensii]